MTRLAAEFKAAWPSVAVQLTAEVADRHDYLVMLDEIEAHGLPDHENRFRDLLRERSRDLIGELLNEIYAASHEIEDRVAPINSSLLRSRFDEGRYLRLKVKTRRGETVNAFIADLRRIVGGGWNEDDSETAEERYATLAEVMRRFASSEHVDRVWRTQCLDTRLHVSFLAEEIDDHGRAHATYDSGAAMSGGQRRSSSSSASPPPCATSSPTPTRRSRSTARSSSTRPSTRPMPGTRGWRSTSSSNSASTWCSRPRRRPLQTIEPYVGALRPRSRTRAGRRPWPRRWCGRPATVSVMTEVSGR